MNKVYPTPAPFEEDAALEFEDRDRRKSCYLKPCPITDETIMKMTMLILWLFGASSGSAADALKRGEVDLEKLPTLQPHYQAEYAFDTSTDPASWTKQKMGLHVAFGSTDELYLRCEVPALKQETEV